MSYYKQSLSRARARYEAARSFDMDDDFLFCPATTEHELSQQSYDSTSSYSSSDSPHTSPTTHQAQPFYQSQFHLHPPQQQPSLMQPPPQLHPTPQQSKASMIARSKSPKKRTAIAIVDPTTGMRISSPPLAQQQAALQKSLAGSALNPKLAFQSAGYGYNSGRKMW